MRVNHSGVISEIDSLPGCSQIAVVHGVYLEESWRGKGYGQKAQDERLDYIFNDLGYDVSVCTVEVTNRRNIHILKKSGWKFAFSFKSRKTGHKVAMFVRGSRHVSFVSPPEEDKPSETYYSDYINQDRG